VDSRAEEGGGESVRNDALDVVVVEGRR
jgi:hypothetical protein